jgi:hypothetical protein
MGLKSVIQRAAVTAFRAIGDIPKAATLVCKNVREYDPEAGGNLALALVSDAAQDATLTAGNGESLAAPYPTFRMTVDEREPVGVVPATPAVTVLSAITETADEISFTFGADNTLQEVTVQLESAMFGNFDAQEISRAIQRGDELLSTDRKITIPRLFLGGIQPQKGDRITAADEDWIVSGVVSKDPAAALVTLAGRKP